MSALELDLYARDASIISGRAEVVCFPLTTEEVQACVRVCCEHGRPFVPRGSGTGLAGGAVPIGDPVVIVTTKMTRILEVDEEERLAWVEPGVLNLDLTRAVAHLGLHYAPDPSSQQSCSIGGNVATNSGGPHCLLYGVTSAQVAARPGWAAISAVKNGAVYSVPGALFSSPGPRLVLGLEQMARILHPDRFPATN